MPAKCPYCETKTHNDEDKDKFPECIRNFLTADEALSVIDISADDVHVFMNPNGMLIGADWSLGEIKNLINRCYYIERCAPDGMARKMNHGISIVTPQDKERYFIATNEDNLKAYEEKHCKESA